MIVDEIRHSEEICQLPRDLPKFLVISAVKQVLPRDAPTLHDKIDLVCMPGTVTVLDSSIAKLDRYDLFQRKRSTSCMAETRDANGLLGPIEPHACAEPLITDMASAEAASSE